MTDNNSNSIEKKYTSEKTEDIVGQLHEVAEGLNEIVEGVEIVNTSVETEKLDTTEEKVKTVIAGSETPPGQIINENGSQIKTVEPPKIEEIKTGEAIKTTNSEQVSVVSEKDSLSQSKDMPIKIEEKSKNMPENKSKFNPFGFLQKKTVADPATVIKKSKLPRILKAILISVLILIFFLIIIGGVLYLLVNPVISNGQKTMNLANESYQLLKTQDLVKAEPKLQETKLSLLETQKAYQKVTFLKILPVISKYQQDGEAGLKAAVAGVEAGELLIQAILPYADVLGFSGEESTQSGTVEDRVVKIIETLDKVSPQLDAISQKLVIVDSEMQKIDPNDYPEKVKNIELRGKLTQAENLIAEAKKALTDAQPLVKVLPSILGYPEGKKYLVLFQNDGELRPTGGFLSAYAILNLDKGKVSSEKSDDIYGLDGKFTKVLVPPEPIVKHLIEKKWFLRNMNFSPDFKVSMDTFKENYDTLKDEYKVDGIIAIDTQVLSKIIEVIGPLEVPEWGTFTVENDKRCNLPQIICELEHIIDKPLATLVTNRKATILGPMMKALLDKSMGGGKEQLAKLIPLAFELMEEKHVLVYLNDQTQQTAVENFNIGGRIMEYDGDYLHINNANFGGAKSNFYVTETVEQDATVNTDGSVTKKVVLSYKHNESADNCNLEAGELCLSGQLRSYFRVYVPKGSILNEDESRGSMVKFRTGEELGKTYFDGFYELRPQSQVKIELSYTIPYKPSGEYKLFIQKQPGTKSSQHSLTVNGKTETFELKKDSEKKVGL